MKGKQLVITTKGRTAVELIRQAGVELLTSPEMTGHWERRLNEIARGQASAEAFINNVKRFAVQIIDKVRVQRPAVRSAFAAQVQAGTTKARSGKASGGGVSGRSPADSTGRARGSSTGGKSGRAPAASAAADANSAPNALTQCPRNGCGGYIFMGRKGYGCSHYRSGCSFVIWKQSLGKTLTDAMVRALIEKGKTGKLKFTNNSGESYHARIVLANPDTGDLSLERVED